MGVLVPFTTVLVCLLLVSFLTVESTSVSSIPSLDTTLTKRMKMVSCVLLPSSPAHRHLPSLPDTLLTPSTPSVVVSKCSPKSQNPNGSTRELPTASERSSRTKVLVLFSRVLGQTLFVPSVPHLCWCSTLKLLPPSDRRKRFQIMHAIVHS